jgi:hypothetical protein
LVHGKIALIYVPLIRGEVLSDSPGDTSGIESGGSMHRYLTKRIPKIRLDQKTPGLPFLPLRKHELALNAPAL